MPKKGFSSFSATPTHSVSRRMNSVLVVGTHGASVDDGAAVIGERLRKRIAKARFANVELVAVAHEPLADVARIGVLLVQHDANRLLRLRRGSLRRRVGSGRLVRAIR